MLEYKVSLKNVTLRHIKESELMSTDIEKYECFVLGPAPVFTMETNEAVGYQEHVIHLDCFTSTFFIPRYAPHMPQFLVFSW